MVGALLMLIRTWSQWVAGAMFALLLGNMFAPLIDYVVTVLKKKRKLKTTEAATE